MAVIMFSHFLLRPVRIEDFKDYFDFMEANRNRFKNFVAGTVAATVSIEETKNHICRILIKAEHKLHYHFVLVDTLTNKIIGVVLIKDVDWDIPKGELGYFIDTNYEGKGITTMAISEIIKYSFEILNMNKLYLRTYKDNIA